MDKNNKMRPLSFPSHSNFFASLKQVEKRLKLEETPTPAESQLQENNCSVTRDSLASLSCSPMFLHQDQPNCSQNYDAAQDSSEPPLAFLSIPQGFTPTPQQITTVSKAHDDDDDGTAVDDIERLMQLLGLSPEQVQGKDDCLDGEHGGSDSCHCEGGFYSKIVGVKGPKCGKEVQRLDGWIKHLLNCEGEERLEPLRLAHLLLGKAAFVSEGVDGLEFPSTILQFLQNDPPCI